MNQNAMRHRRHLWFSGQVQGVGFRYNSQRIAEGFQVTGYVRNLPDGRVEMLLEGEKREVQACLDALMQQLGPFVCQVREDQQTAQPECTKFEIRY